jgi:hypothetical protein
MIVNIGPYINWWGPHQIADLLKKVKVSEEVCDKIGEYLSNTVLLDICTWIYNKRKRRIKIKIDKYDIWNLFETLSIIILPCLKEFRKNLHGAPGCLDSFNQSSEVSRQICFDFYKEDDELAWKSGHNEWGIILDKMIWSFEQLQLDWEDQFGSGEVDMKSVPIVDEATGEVKLYEMIRGPNDTYIFDSVGYNLHLLRIKDGLNLFSKYYMSLWD